MSGSINRKYKDTIFRMLFKEPANALSLYNALCGSNYADVSQLEYNTLDNAIYMNVKNDVSFIVCDNLHLYEHQSSWTPNMPLRSLIYITSVYQNYIESKQDKSIYGSSIINLPAPQFMVFYNGIEEHPEYSELQLSDSYVGLKGKPDLELKVRVFNINSNMNEDLKQKCPIIAEYSVYVDLIRRYQRTMPIEDAVNKAVSECIKKGILKSFLTQQKAEVISMSIFEYDEEKEMKRIRYSEREYGIEVGREEGSLIGTIETYKELGVSREDACVRLMKKYKLSEEKAHKLLDEYWR